MPTTPSGKNADTTNTAAVLNAIRNDVGGEYAAAVPQAYAAGDTMPNGLVATEVDALTRLREIGTVITNYKPYANAFLNQLVNRIGLVLIRNKLYSNPWAFFKKGYLELGETIEEIFVEICRVHQYDPEVASQQWMRREIPNVQAVFHSLNFKKFYKQTTQPDSLRTAFTYWGGLNDLVSKIVTAMYTSRYYDEFLMFKYLAARAIINGLTFPQVISTPSLANADGIVLQMKTISDNVTYMSEAYNYMGVTNYTDKTSQYLIMATDFSAAVDVGSLARAFNLQYVELAGRTVNVNNFTFTASEMKRLADLVGNDPTFQVFTADELTLLSQVKAMLIDGDFFQVYDYLEDFDEEYNREGRYWQHWLHVWQVYSVSPFVTAISFTTGASTVTSVSISPSTFTALPGQAVGFTVQVQTTGIASQAYDLTSSAYNIGKNGVLQIPTDAPDGTVTVTATSRVDPTKTATATVTIGDNTPIDPPDPT